MDESTVAAIMALRHPDLATGPAGRGHETWLLVEGLVDFEQMRRLTPFINGGGDVYRAQADGYFDQGGPAFRAEAIVDATAAPPQIRLWRELSRFGSGFERLGAPVATQND